MKHIHHTTTTTNNNNNNNMKKKEAEGNSFFSAAEVQDHVVKRTWIMTITAVPSSGQIEHCRNLNVLEPPNQSIYGSYLGFSSLLPIYI